MWLQHMSGLLAASVIVTHAIERNNRPVLIHCSDGWDRTPQIAATAQLCLDPFYRTIDGFRMLVEKEWLSFGHKFGDRCGHGVGSEETNERCPVFLQWIDCVHQIHKQFPCSFEFSMSYLIKLSQHVHSCLFGTFLCNTMKERLENSIPDRSFSVWPFLTTAIYKNPLYQPNREKVLWPAYNVRDLSFWQDVYLGSFNIYQNHEETSNIDDVEAPTDKSMTKTRSFDDLVKEMKSRETSRRLSDPAINIGDPNISIPMNMFDETGDEDFNESYMSDKLNGLVMQNGNGSVDVGSANQEINEVSDSAESDSKETSPEETFKEVINGIKDEKVCNEDVTEIVETNSQNTSKLIDASSETLVPDDDVVDGSNEKHLMANGTILNQSTDQKHDETVSNKSYLTKMGRLDITSRFQFFIDGCNFFIIKTLKILMHFIFFRIL